MLFDLLEEEGLCVGGSTGINVAGAIRLARELGPGHTIVTLLCDHGARYQSKLFDAGFLAARGLPLPPWMRAASRRSRDDLPPALRPRDLQLQLPARGRAHARGAADRLRCSSSSSATCALLRELELRLALQRSRRTCTPTT